MLYSFSDFNFCLPSSSGAVLFNYPENTIDLEKTAYLADNSGRCEGISFNNGMFRIHVPFEISMVKVTWSEQV